MSYYQDKIDTLARLFGNTDVQVGPETVRVGDTTYDVVDDVIIALPPHLRPGAAHRVADGAFAGDIQETFGREWQRFNQVLPEQRIEFDQYFDLVDLDRLSESLVCDLGAGMGRWSWFLAPYCRQLALVDFSDAIFVARQNLRHVPSTVFVMADLADLPLADDACDFALCLGVLHTLPDDPIAAVRSLARLSPRLLVYLMYALDNKPGYFRALLGAVTVIRGRTARLRNEKARRVLASAIATTVYRPLIAAGRLAEPFGGRHLVPLAEANAGKSVEGIRQVVYDRFFTSIEHRVTASRIDSLSSAFSEVSISPNPPYWHFECRR